MLVTLIGPDGKLLLHIKAENTSEGCQLGRLSEKLHLAGVPVDSLIDDVDEVYLRVSVAKSPDSKEATD